MTDHLMPTYGRVDVAFTRGEGPWLEAEDGRRFLDFGAGIAVNALGHAHPKLVAALAEQAGRLWHTSNLYRMPEGERLAARLCELTFADRVFFCNSGVEALEGSIKTARRFHHVNGRGERWRVITFESAFHGRSLATLAAGNQAKHLDGFGPKVDGFDQVPFDDMAALAEAIGPETAAVLLEPVQGEGGMRAFSPESLRRIRELCDEHGILLLFDEVQCGVARTGKLFAHEWAGVTPDVMAIAKGIGGGFPMGAFLATEAAAAGMTAGTHGSTFGGNPLAMAVGNAVLDVVAEDEFLDNVRRVSDHFRQELARLLEAHGDMLEEVRGRGLMIGVKARVPVGEIQAAAFDQGLLTVPAGDNVLRILPPLNIGPEEVQAAMERLDAALAALDAQGEAA